MSVNLCEYKQILDARNEFFIDAYDFTVHTKSWYYLDNRLYLHLTSHINRPCKNEEILSVSSVELVSVGEHQILMVL